MKFSKLFLMCFALIALILSCAEVQKPESEDQNSDKKNYEARKKMLTNIVPLDDAVKMYNNYSEKRIKPLKDSLKKKYGKDFNDTRIISIDIETMKQYIAYIEERSKDLNVKPEGLQFYFGVYSNKNIKTDKKKNHQTFFIAPSTLKDSIQSGYTLETKNGKVQILYLKNVLKNKGQEVSGNQKMEKASFFTTSIVQDDGLLLNRGVPNPPGDNN